MKKLLPLFILTMLLSSCTPNTLKTEDRSPDVQSDTNSLKFQIDSRVETLYIVFLLSDYPLLTPFTGSYKTDALEYFGKHKSHNAVVLAKALVEKGFVADYAVNWLFQFSDFPDFVRTGTVNFPFSMRPLPADSLEIFRKELINFYHETDCDGFFKTQDVFLHPWYPESGIPLAERTLFRSLKIISV